MPLKPGSSMRKIFASTSSTALSGVEAPDVTPMVRSPCGSQSVVSRNSPYHVLCAMLRLSTSIRAAQSTQKEGRPFFSAISCKWLVLLELNPPTTTIRSMDSSPAPQPKLKYLERAGKYKTHGSEDRGSSPSHLHNPQSDAIHSRQPSSIQSES